MSDFAILAAVAVVLFGGIKAHDAWSRRKRAKRIRNYTERVANHVDWIDPPDFYSDSRSGCDDE